MRALAHNAAAAAAATVLQALKPFRAALALHMQHLPLPPPDLDVARARAEAADAAAGAAAFPPPAPDEAQRECCICFTSEPVGAGIFCRAPSAHFACNDCFDGHLNVSLNGGDVVAFAARGWALHCPIGVHCLPQPPAAGSAFTIQDLGRHANEATLAQYIAAREGAAEQRVIAVHT